LGKKGRKIVRPGSMGWLPCTNASQTILELSRSSRTDFDRLLLCLVTGNGGVTGAGGDEFC
jgi:hypothetical protein